MGHRLERAAAGRIARLGDLYDARTDTFVGLNAYNVNLNEDYNSMGTDVNEVEITVMTSEVAHEKLEKLQIDPNLGLSIFSGLIDVKGSLSYLNDQKKSAKASRMTLAYSMKTVEKEIISPSSNVIVDCLDATEATHVVVGVVWGARCNVVCEHENINNEDEEVIRAILKTDVEKLKRLSQPKKALETVAEESCKDISYYIKCDLGGTDHDKGTDFQHTLELFRSIPDEIKKLNGGKGIPVAYKLLSLDILRKMCRQPKNNDVILKLIKQEVVSAYMSTIDEIVNTQQKLQCLIEDLKKDGSLFPPEPLKNVQELLIQFEDGKRKFEEAFKATLLAVRSGNEDVAVLENVLKEFHGSESSPMNTLIKTENYDGAREKLIFINDLLSQNVAYLGPEEIYEEFLCKHSSKTLYVMYMDYAVRVFDTVRWTEQIDLFSRILQSYRYHSGVQLVVIDSEIHPNVCKAGKMYIELYEQGHLICEDLFAKEGAHLQVCTLKMDKLENFRRKPNKMVFLEVRCPMSFMGKCPTDACQWTCRNCKDLIQYDVKNDYLYCHCGKSLYTNASFRCSEKSHGIEYVRFPPLQAEEVFSELKKVEETNILILGETGVGKSTWINALANYLLFPTLQEASESEDIKVLIPSQFSYTSETGETKSIAVGAKSDNEVLAAGQSATQGPQAYKFNVGKRIICLIDTPGIGDVRGLEQDEKNFENILSHLAYYDEIHGICILLKPNDSRLSVTFRFCITELLTHLHKTAAQNVMFCFTNARGTFYRPGDTLPVLQKLVSEYKGANVKIDPSNQFCFDNESFRVLACMRNGIKFHEKDIETYSSSWDHSVAETKRLFEYVQGLHPHTVKETMSLNNARRIILELSKPLAEIASTIQKNIDAANRKANELQASKATASDLQNKLYLDAVDLRPIHLNYPRTVCTDATCVEYITIFDNTKKTVYSQHCHAHCCLEGIPTEVVNNPKLQHCWAIDGGQSITCRICNHSWKVHMHMTYDLEQVKKRVVDQHVKSLLSEKDDDATKLKKFIENVYKYAEELREEQHEITDICAQFGCYLKKNAITPYNDQIDAHIEMLINQEESKPDRDQRAIDNLVAMRRKYSEKKRVITEAMKRPDLHDVDFISSPEKVDELKKTLFQLKHNGETLRNIFYKIQRVQSEYRHCQAQLQPLRPSSGKRQKRNQGRGLMHDLRNMFSHVVYKIKNPCR